MQSAGGVRTLLTDRNKLIMTVGGVTALAAGIYTTRFVCYPLHVIQINVISLNKHTVVDI